MMAQTEIKHREKRQAEGIKVSKEKSVKFGKPEIQINNEFIKIMHMVDNKNLTNVQAM